MLQDSKEKPQQRKVPFLFASELMKVRVLKYEKALELYCFD